MAQVVVILLVEVKDSCNLHNAKLSAATVLICLARKNQFHNQKGLSDYTEEITTHDPCFIHWKLISLHIPRNFKRVYLSIDSISNFSSECLGYTRYYDTRLA